jgi:hypothetical protein
VELPPSEGAALSPPPSFIAQTQPPAPVLVYFGLCRVVCGKPAFLLAPAPCLGLACLVGRLLLSSLASVFWWLLCDGLRGLPSMYVLGIYLVSCRLPHPPSPYPPTHPYIPSSPPLAGLCALASCALLLPPAHNTCVTGRPAKTTAMWLSGSHGAGGAREARPPGARRRGAGVRQTPRNTCRYERRETHATMSYEQ